MLSIRPRRIRKAVSAVTLEDEFDSLRDAFRAHLQTDRLQLTIFAAALARADGDATKLFEHLRQFAHKIGGVAAIFRTPPVADAAHRLEQAAAAAAEAHAHGSDSSVWAALVALTDVLTSMG